MDNIHFLYYTKLQKKKKRNIFLHNRLIKKNFHLFFLSHPYSYQDGFDFVCSQKKESICYAISDTPYFLTYFFIFFSFSSSRTRVVHFVTLTNRNHCRICLL